MKTLITGATGLTGTLFIKMLAQQYPETEITCITRPSSNRSDLEKTALKIHYLSGDTSQQRTWEHLFQEMTFDRIFHLVQLRQVPFMLRALASSKQSPHLNVIGTTGIYSKYNQYSDEYKVAEIHLNNYPGMHCLLRPTMIYGYPSDKNIHKLIKFCHRYHCFPIFGSGDNLLQPVHAEDIAKVLVYLWENPNHTGDYNLSGKTIISLRKLLDLISSLINKPVRQINFPIQFGLSLASICETVFKSNSPIKVEQILRLQEHKVFPYDNAQIDLSFNPRSLEEGLQEEVRLLKQDSSI